MSTSLLAHVILYPGNKRKGSSNDKQSGPKKRCSKCMQLNRDGEKIPTYVMENHSVADCTSTKRSKDSKSNNADAATGTLSKATVNQLVQATVYAVTAILKPTSANSSGNNRNNQRSITNPNIKELDS